MRFVEAGGARISVIGVGTWQFGSREWGYGEDYATREAGAIVARALDLGVNLIDTAEVYAFGRSERIVGRAVAGRREQAFVATKVFPVLPLAPVVVQRGRASARRLGVATIDLYQVHWPNPLVPVGTTMDGMARLVEAGVVRHVGVSNFDAARWREAEAALGRPVLTNQVQYSLVARGPERDVLPHARDAGRIVIAHSPLAQGLLSGRYDGRVTPRGGVRAASARFRPDNLERAQPLLGALQAVATAHGATPAQVALAWVIRHPNVVAIPGASTVAQLEQNVAAADLALSDEDAARLTEAAERYEPVRHGGGALGRLLRMARR